MRVVVLCHGLCSRYSRLGGKVAQALFEGIVTKAQFCDDGAKGLVLFMYPAGLLLYLLRRVHAEPDAFRPPIFQVVDLFPLPGS